MLTFFAFVETYLYSIPPEPRMASERSEARASDLFPNFPEYKTPTLSYETHPNDLKFG